MRRLLSNIYIQSAREFVYPVSIRIHG